MKTQVDKQEPKMISKKAAIIIISCIMASSLTIVGIVFFNSNDNTNANNPSNVTSLPETNGNNIMNVEIDAEAIFNNNKVKFKIKTNLPDNTELIASLSYDERNYKGEDKVVVLGGYCETDEFTDNNSSLGRGSYKLEITSGIASVQPLSVQKVIGEKGINLQGIYIKEDPILGNTVYFEKIIGMYEEHSHASVTENERVNDLLYDAVKNEDKSSIKKYLSQGADINYIEAISKVTPLMLACVKGNEDLIIYLIDNGADVNRKNYSGSTAVFYCGRRERIVKLLQSKGADINIRANDGHTYKSSVKAADH